MPTWKKLMACALTLMLSLAASGCALFTPTRTPPRVVDTATKSFRPLATQPEDSCATQRAAAAHNSVYDSLRGKGRKVYCAPCDCPELYPDRQPPAAAPATAAKMS